MFTFLKGNLLFYAVYIGKNRIVTHRYITYMNFTLLARDGNGCQNMNFLETKNMSLVWFMVRKIEIFYSYARLF